jgi:hypothetical protein
MTTEDAVDHNDQTLRGILMSIQDGVAALLKVDYDQVQWEVIGEISQVANTIVNIINPEIQE